MKKKIEVLDVDGHCDGCLLETDHCHKLWSGKLGLHYCVDGEDAKEEDCHEGIIRVLKHRVDFLGVKSSALEHFIDGVSVMCEECTESKNALFARDKAWLWVLGALLGVSWLCIVLLLVR